MQKKLNNQEQIKQLEILYLGLFSGQLLIFGLLFFFVKDTISPIVEGTAMEGTMSIIVGFFCIMSISTSFFIYNKRKETGRQLRVALDDKLAHYRISFLTRAAMIEGANLVALIVHFFIEKNMVYLVFFAIGIGAFIFIRPTVDRIIEDYQLSASEQSDLRNSLN